MRRIVLALCVLGGLAATAAAAEKYLAFPDMASCLARSQQQCQAMGCDGKSTIYWWRCEKLMDGTAAIETRPGDPQFDATTTNAVAKSATGLSAGEQSALRTRMQMSTNLPDIIASADWLGKLTATQKSRIQTWADNHPGAAATIWNDIKGGADVDLRDARVAAIVAAARLAGLIADADAAALMMAKAVP